jgi:membrane protease YdiL (CAAX protease family)
VAAAQRTAAPKKAAPKRAAPAKKAAPKRAAPKKTAPGKPVGKGAAPKSARTAPRKVPVKPPAPAPTHDPAWVVVDDAPAAAPVPEPVPAPAPGALPPGPLSFNPATGDWVAAPPLQVAAPPASVQRVDDGTAPDAPRGKDSVLYVLSWILFGIDLFLLGLNALGSLIVGGILVFAPHSSAADSIREKSLLGSPGQLLALQLATFVLFGVIPFLWVLGTRRSAWEGMKRYLHLHAPGPSILRGIGLALLALATVAVVAAIYVVATKGVGGLTHPDQGNSTSNDPEGLVKNLTWPVAVVVALTAGIGEEIFFRGVVQKAVGVWWQGILFGLAHAANGNPLQVAFAFVLGVVFGFIIKRGGSLWTTMTAHALYDFTLLAITLATR